MAKEPVSSQHFQEKKEEEQSICVSASRLGCLSLPRLVGCLLQHCTQLRLFPNFYFPLWISYKSPVCTAICSPPEQRIEIIYHVH